MHSLIQNICIVIHVTDSFISYQIPGNKVEKYYSELEQNCRGTVTLPLTEDEMLGWLLNLSLNLFTHL